MGALRTGTFTWITVCTTATPPTPLPMVNPQVRTHIILNIHIWQLLLIMLCHPHTTPLWGQPLPLQLIME